MATSCGSPCYAAPELVINDDENNHYVGTAVDIWSCGVILFAMLCGYLPFDDDPSNPQGANINVLYKYIVSTKLEIPSHMSQDATNLLRIMLVPDPTKRCNMDQIRNHPWLKEHSDLLSVDFIAIEKAEEELQGHMKKNKSDTRVFNSVNQVIQTYDNTILPPSVALIDTQTTTTTTTTIPESRQEEESPAVVPPCTTTTHDQNNNNDDVPSLKEEEEEEEEIVMITPNTPPTPTTTTTSTINTEEEQVVPTTPKPTSTNNNTTTTSSFLQAKFFSTLQQRSNNNNTPTTKAPINNKIPNRSQSVQQSRRERTTSELLYYTNNNKEKNNNKHMSLNILPSVSEQTTIVLDQQQITPSASQAIRTKGQKLMDWFKRKPSSSQSKFLS